MALAASHDLTLEGQAEQHTLKSSNKNASGGVGLQIGTDGIGFYAEASVGKGKAHGNGGTHTDTVVDAADTLSLTAGNDATIQGAQAKGNAVLADVGHNLTITSEQDTGDYASTQWQAGGKVVVGMCAGASGYASYGKVDSHYASVTAAPASMPAKAAIKCTWATPRTWSAGNWPARPTRARIYSIPVT